MVWCGDRKGRVPTKPRDASSTPATLWMRVVSIASSSDIGGMMVVASITNEAVDDLKLASGKTAYAVIKASDVMVGVD